MGLCRVGILSASLLLLAAVVEIEARSKMFDLFKFPDTRRGRATPPNSRPSSDVHDPTQDIYEEEVGRSRNNFYDEILDSEEFIMDAIKSISKAEVARSTFPAHPAVPSPVAPRKVDEPAMNRFGENMEAFALSSENFNNFPQLRGQSPPRDVLRQNLELDGGSVDANGVRCIPKVMQIEEVVYDRAIKCHHTYQEKCHLTYITDYQSTSEEKCETTFKKNCHITFKPMPYNETVSICNTPIERSCGSEPVGPDICSTQYETNCETRYNTYEVEQDEPVCTMEVEKKCKNVTVTVPRTKRQAETTTVPSADTSGVTEEQPGTTVQPEDSGNQDEVLTFDQQCEEWPVQKCTLEKRMVKKVHPETACKNIPREICVPDNCKTVQGEEVCFDEVRVQVQNVPQEECDLQPEETCHMEAILVPKLVPQNNCVKVPKEICVNTKTNPRKVKKPIVKEWCYKPAEVAANGGF